MSKLRIAVTQIRPKKGDYAENLRRIGAVFAQVAKWDEPPAVLVFPECITSGYFVEGGVRDVAVTGGTLFCDLKEQHSQSGAPPLEVLVGFYEDFRDTFYNSALYASLGEEGPQVRHVHRKVFLPTYGVFDEQRFVANGHGVQAFDTRWGRAATVICEDAWHSLVPTLAALDGAQLLLVPSAAPARGVQPDSARDADGNGAVPNSVDRWNRLARSIAEEHGVFVAVAQLVGFEGGKGFPGGSVIVGPSGAILAAAPLFEDAIVATSIDLADIKRVRADSPLLADLEVELPNLVRVVEPAEPREPGLGPEGAISSRIERATTASHPVVTGLEARDPLAFDPKLLEKWLTAFLKDEVVRRRAFTKGLVGLSGGVDSSLTAYLAVRALGKENVIGVRMPYRTSSKESGEHAALVASSLCIELLTVDVSSAVDGYYKALGEEGDPTRRGNVMARTRMIALFDLSAKLNALPLGTGNKTERLLGYFTWHADDSPPVNPLGDLFKTQVWELARYMGVPDEIVSKPASADLVQGQTDEGDLGIPYSKADPILHWLLRGLKPREIAELGFTEQEIEVVQQRLASTHWKRRLPTVAMVSQTAIGEYYLRPVDY